MTGPSRRLATLSTAGALLVLAALVAILWSRGGASDAAIPGTERDGAAEETDALQALPTADRDARERLEAPAEAAPDPASTPPGSTSSRVILLVTDIDQLPVAGALAELLDEDLPGAWRTDADGRCTLPIEPGDKAVRLRCSADGFVTDCTRGTPTAEIAGMPVALASTFLGARAAD